MALKDIRKTCAGAKLHSTYVAALCIFGAIKSRSAKHAERWGEWGHVTRIGERRSAYSVC